MLRGEGNGPDGTVLVGTGRAQRSLVEVKGPGYGALGQEQAIADDFVPVGARSFRIAGGTRSRIGAVIARRAGNAAWIHAIGMDRITPRASDPKSTKQWQPFDLDFERIVTHVEAAR